MKDIAHHRKFIQKKVLKDIKQSKKSEEKEAPPQELREEGPKDRLTPEFEGERFDPHHRKPRLLKRINYH